MSVPSARPVGRPVLVALVALALLAAEVSVTSATTFPGRNGKIALQSGYGAAGCPRIGLATEAHRVRFLTTEAHCDTGLEDPDFSPSGQRIAFGGGFFSGISSIRVDGTGRRGLTPGTERLPMYLPDGRIAAQGRSGQEGDLDTYIVRGDGTGFHRLFEHAAEAVSADGTRFLTAENGRLRVLDENGRQLRRLALGAEQPSFSPDGRWIVFARRHKEPGQTRLYLVRTDGTGRQMPLIDVADGQPSPVFSPDGRWIAYCNSNRFGYKRGLFAVSVKDPSKHYLVADLKGSNECDPAWQRAPR
jgi:Tol biopolymer transport system component